jgi:hypothetical protein
MPETVVLLSKQENERIEKYAYSEGITKEEALKSLALENIRGRLKTRFKRGEVKAFKSPKSD